MDFYSIILGAALHMIDLIMWFLDSKPVTVYAVGNKLATLDSKLNYNSFATIVLQFKNGTIAKITGNGGCVHPHYHGIKIYGTEMTAEQNYNQAYYLKSSEPGTKPKSITEPYPDKDNRYQIIHSFIDSIIDPTAKPIVQEKEVFDLMSVCLAAEESMNEGKKVNIKYLS